MKNQHNNQVSKELLKFRKEIDKIDDKIIKLLEERMDIVDKVGKHKKNNNELFLIRSNREADMIKDLVTRSNGSIPKSVIVSIWRKIITSANASEQNLKIAIHNPHEIADYSYLVKEYYGDFIPISTHNSATNIISEIQKGTIQIGIFALPNEQNNNCQNDDSKNWWVHIANNSQLKIYTKIPFAHYQDEALDNKTNLVAVALKNVEKSTDDKTLLSIEVNKDINSHQFEHALKKMKTNYRILKTAKLSQIENIIFYLVEIDGFLETEDEAINKLSKTDIKPYIKVIGHYPTPIEIKKTY